MPQVNETSWLMLVLNLFVTFFFLFTSINYFLHMNLSSAQILHLNFFKYFI